ncbi:MAG: YidC/Oxa1 family membrane protein insertase [Candidatus Sungbacteria bacterium]|nr:YidC/Oxa1 family membrane protein insertase [bacterium]MDZ4260529.1 YidC/Oxa1 family membrane protein insertase [Candidatus Sungbacteria bacterium]
MEIFSLLYTELLWQPLFNGLVFFYTIFPIQDLGLSIIALTVVIRGILAPVLWKAQKAQKDLQLIQPEIKKIQDQHKNDKEGQGRALMELYARHKVNPFSGCLMMLIQFPILIALLHVFQNFDASYLSYVYSFLPHPDSIRTMSFGFLDLAKGNIYLGVIAAVTQYFQTKMTMVVQPESSGSSFAKSFQTQTLYIFPVMILIWSFKFASALTLYWTVMNVFGILQELVMRRIEARKKT